MERVTRKVAFAMRAEGKGGARRVNGGRRQLWVEERILRLRQERAWSAPLATKSMKSGGRGSQESIYVQFCRPF